MENAPYEGEDRRARRRRQQKARRRWSPIIGLVVIAVAAAAKQPKVVYVDTFDLLATQKGGCVVSLRSGDGVDFANQGAWRIAAAVWAAMKRDWRPAQ